jgi:hypothetical protein
MGLTKRSRALLVAVIVVLAVCLAGSIAYISLLGENNRIDDLVGRFFEMARAGRYDDVASMLSPEARSRLCTEPGRFSDSVFFLELSLLSYYDLLDCDDYTVAIRKTHFWIPYIEERPIRISISLMRKQGSPSHRIISNFADVVSRPEKENFIRSLFSVERKGGRWVITDINVDGSAIAKTYADLRQNAHLDRYASVTHNGFAMHEFKVRADEMTPAERRILLHVLRKTQLLIKENHEQGS